MVNLFWSSMYILYTQKATTAHSSSSSLIEFKRSILNPNNKFHRNIQIAMKKMKIKTELTSDHLAFINYLHLIHRGINKLESIRQIIDRIETEIEHECNISSHYKGGPDVQNALKCLSLAQRELDDAIIASNEYISFCEDGNSLRGLGARGYIVKAFKGYKLVELFYKLQETAKRASLAYVTIFKQFSYFHLCLHWMNGI